jgi:hypothetical protein
VLLQGKLGIGKLLKDYVLKLINKKRGRQRKKDGQ